jgi:hypothetical protein
MNHALASGVALQQIVDARKQQHAASWWGRQSELCHSFDKRRRNIDRQS